jgi:hypothetical protein
MGSTKIDKIRILQINQPAKEAWGGLEDMHAKSTRAKITGRTKSTKTTTSRKNNNKSQDTLVTGAERSCGSSAALISVQGIYYGVATGLGVAGVVATSRKRGAGEMESRTVDVSGIRMR